MASLAEQLIEIENQITIKISEQKSDNINNGRESMANLHREKARIEKELARLSLQNANPVVSESLIKRVENSQTVAELYAGLI